MNAKRRVLSRESNLHLLRSLLAGLGGLLGEEDRVDVGEHTALGDGDAAEQLVQLLVVADSELQVPGDDPGLLVVAGSVSGELENLGNEVLEDGGEVDGGAGTDTKRRRAIEVSTGKDKK